jgi:hypothetical protein
MGQPRQKIWYEEGMSTAVGNRNYKDEDNEYTEEK